MLKNISNLGSTLSKSDQKSINGGAKNAQDCGIIPLVNNCLSGDYDDLCICIP